MPAVARAGAERALTATRSPSVTIVSSPLRTTTAPDSPRGLAAREARRWAATSSESQLEQPAELARMRGQDRRRRAGGDPVQRAGEGVEPVGVDHQRRLDLADHLPGQLDRGRVPAEARARRRRRRPARTHAGPPSPRPAPGSRRRPGSRPTSPPAGRSRRPARDRPGPRRSRSRRRPGSPPARTSARRRSGRASRRRSSPGRS